MIIDKKWLNSIAVNEGFVRDTLEKVLRLTEVLKFINAHPIMRECLALKGGTAINLTVFNMPRLSVDIDLDYSKDVDRDGMLEDRSVIQEDIEKYMNSEGYQRSEKSKSRHSLDSSIYYYQNAAGINDNIKIEINYSMRTHIYPLVHRKIQTDGVFEEFEVLSLEGTEIFGSKIKALLDRAAPRDLYDVDNMIRFGLFDGEEERANLRKCALFYMAVGNKEVPQNVNLTALDEITWHNIKTDLNPVKRKREKFDLETSKKRVSTFLEEVMRLEESELRFMQSFRALEYHPEYLFNNPDIVKRLENHPMAMWKMQDCTALRSRVL